MRLGFLGLALRMPFPPPFLKGPPVLSSWPPPTSLADRLGSLLEGRHARADMLALRGAVRVLAACPWIAVPWQAGALGVQQPIHGPLTDRMPLGVQAGGPMRHAPTVSAARTHRIRSSHRLQGTLPGRQQAGLPGSGALPRASISRTPAHTTVRDNPVVRATWVTPSARWRGRPLPPRCVAAIHPATA